MSNILPGSPDSDTDTEEPAHEVRTPRVAGADALLQGVPGDFAHLNKLQLQAIYRGVHTHGARPAEEHSLILALSDRYVAIEDDGSFGAAYKLHERVADGQHWSTRVYVDEPNSTCGAMPPRVLIRTDHPKLSEALQHFTLEPEVSEETQMRVIRAFARVPDQIWDLDLVPKEHPLDSVPTHVLGAKRLYVTSIDERTSYDAAPTYKHASPYESGTQSVPTGDAAIAAMNGTRSSAPPRISGHVLKNPMHNAGMLHRDLLTLSLVHNAFYGKASAAEARWVAENLMFRKGHPEDLRTLGIAFAFPMKFDAGVGMVPDDSAYAPSADRLPLDAGNYSSVLAFATRNAHANCWPRVGVPVVRLAFLGLDAKKPPNYLNGFHGSRKLYPLVHQMMLVVHERIQEMNLQSDYAVFLKACPLSKNEKETGKVSFMNLRRDVVREIDKLDPRLTATLASGASVPPDWPLEEYREAVAKFIARVATLPIGTAWVRTRSPLFPEGIRYKRVDESTSYPMRMVATGAKMHGLGVAGNPRAPGDAEIYQMPGMEAELTQEKYKAERDAAGFNPLMTERMETMLEPYTWLPTRKHAPEEHLKAFPNVYSSEWEVQLVPLLHKKEEALNGATLIDPNEYFGTPKNSAIARYVLWVLKTRFGTHVGPRINVGSLPSLEEIGRAECTDPCVLNSVIKKLIRRSSKDDTHKEELAKQVELLNTCRTALNDAQAGLKNADAQCQGLNDKITALRQTSDGHKRKAEHLETEVKRLKTEATNATAKTQRLEQQLRDAPPPPPNPAPPPAPPAAASSSRKLVATPGKEHAIELSAARAAANPDDLPPDSTQTIRFKAPKGALMLMTPAPSGYGCRVQDLSRFDQRDISIVFTPASPASAES